MEKKSEKILILEDEKEVGQLYVKSLKEQGYDPMLATDGLEGLKKLKTLEPDLILLDLGMPKMNGIEFYQFICDAKGRPKYPVLLLTGRTDLETVFKDFNVEGIIIKPFKKEQLLNDIEIILNKQYQRKLRESAQKITIVDEDQASALKISDALTGAGYNCEIVPSGLEGIERIMADPPDLAVVNLNLGDMSGDLVILRLQGMIKTRGVKYLLYIPPHYTLDKIVAEKIALKTGVKLMCESGDPAEIVEAVAKVFQAPQ